MGIRRKDEISAQDLLDLKRKIQEMKQEEGRLKGVLKYLKDELAKDGMSVVAARKKLRKAEEEISRISRRIEEESKLIREEFDI